MKVKPPLVPMTDAKRKLLVALAARRRDNPRRAERVAAVRDQMVTVARIEQQLDHLYKTARRRGPLNAQQVARVKKLRADLDAANDAVYLTRKLMKDAK